MLHRCLRHLVKCRLFLQRGPIAQPTYIHDLASDGLAAGVAGLALHVLHVSAISQGGYLIGPITFQSV